MCSEAPPQSGGGLVKAPPRLNVPHTGSPSPGAAARVDIHIPQLSFIQTTMTKQSDTIAAGKLTDDVTAALTSAAAEVASRFNS